MIDRTTPGSGKSADRPARRRLRRADSRAAWTQGPGADAPHVMRSSLAAPVHLRHALRARAPAARRLGRVDRAWDDAPTTSEQILHADKWLAHEPALRRRSAAVRAARRRAGRSADEDSEGELGTRIAFEEWMRRRRPPPRPAPAGAATAACSSRERRQLPPSPGASATTPARRTTSSRAAPSRPSCARPRRSRSARPTVHDAAFACHERADRGPIACPRGRRPGLRPRPGADHGGVAAGRAPATAPSRASGRARSPPTPTRLGRPSR